MRTVLFTASAHFAVVKPVRLFTFVMRND